MSANFPRSFIEQLLARIEIVDLIDSRVTLQKKSGANYFGCCPFHAEKNPSFSVSQKKQFYYCFGCGAHGNAIDFLIQYDRLTFPEAIEILAKQTGIEIPQASARSTAATPSSLPAVYSLLEKVVRFYQTQLMQQMQAVTYLQNRQISPTIASVFCLGYAPAGWDSLLKALGNTPQHQHILLTAGMLIKKESGGYYDRFRDRLMFPIHDRRGRVIGFGGRVLASGDPKYLNSPETILFQKSHELYGLYHALQANRHLKQAIIVEGYMDVIALYQYNITYAMATLGTATTPHHLKCLLRYTSDIIFCFDGDTAGQTAAWRALQVTLPLMEDGIQIRFLFLPDGEDPDSMVRKEGKDRFEQRISQATSYADFLFDSLAQQTNLTTTDGRARYVKLATDLLNLLPDSVFRRMMFEQLARRARVSVDNLQQLSPSPTPPTRRTPKLKSRPPSALRLALSLLIQQPHLINHLTEDLPALAIPGYDLFTQVVTYAKQNPQLTTGGLLEYWRGQPQAKILAKLAQSENMIADQGLEQEFLGAIKQLKKLALEHAIDTLLTQSAHSGLSLEEKNRLLTLIQNKENL